jgi:hypothetical protein
MMIEPDTYLENFIKLDEVPQDHIPMRFKDSQSDEKDKSMGVIICPKDFPQSEDIIEWELSLERDENPSGGENSIMMRMLP